MPFTDRLTLVFECSVELWFKKLCLPGREVGNAHRLSPVVVRLLGHCMSVCKFGQMMWGLSVMVTVVVKRFVRWLRYPPLMGQGILHRRCLFRED